MEPTSVGILRWYIQEKIKSNHTYWPALAGIYGWYIHRHTTCSYIICTKLKIFSAFLQTNTRQFPDGYNIEFYFFLYSTCS